MEGHDSKLSLGGRGDKVQNYSSSPSVPRRLLPDGEDYAFFLAPGVQKTVSRRTEQEGDQVCNLFHGNESLHQITVQHYLRNSRIPSHLLENKTLPARDKSTSKCIFTLCKMRAYASWPEHALSPIGGAESRCPLLSAILACRRGKFNQGVSSVKNLVKRVWYWLLSAGGERQQPPEEARCSIN